MKSAKILFVCGICQKESHKIIKTSEEVIKRLQRVSFSYEKTIIICDDCVKSGIAEKEGLEEIKGKSNAFYRQLQAIDSKESATEKMELEPGREFKIVPE